MPAQSSPTNAKTVDKYDELSDQIDTLRADISKIASSIGGIAESEADDARRRVKGAAKNAQTQARKLRREARRQGELQIEHASDYVRENPMTAVAAAAALGLVFGFITARR